jgi:hypothetical protein
LRPPAALWGYDMRSTDEALNMVARTVTDRDVEIAILRRQIADLEAVAKEPGVPAKAPPPAKPQAPAMPQAHARPPVKGVSGPLPSPFQLGAGAGRPAGEPPSWSAWQRPGASPSPAPEQPPAEEPGEQRDRERGTG